MKTLAFLALCWLALTGLPAGDAPLIPVALNNLLPKIHTEMTIQQVEAVLATAYPMVKGRMGVWSGQTGYVDYQLDERYTLAVSSKMVDGKEVVHEDLLFYLKDLVTKHRVDIKSYFWESPSQKNTKFFGQ